MKLTPGFSSRMKLRYKFYQNSIKKPIQGSISPTFYSQLLCVQIPKAQKDLQLDCIFCAFAIFPSNSCDVGETDLES